GEINLSNYYFSPLPGTAQEAQMLAAILPQADLFTQAQASKLSLMKVNYPHILHIATHGFFISETSAKNSVVKEARNILLPNNGEVKKINPLLRSGLVLAGANRQSENNEGIMTALEVTGLNLWGTKLVVLS